ncbi:MAG: 3'(2'),5'-bisphosphate nucleotidase CysQ [Bacteroidota bacterium]|nr:3'(2'),5'-bisphosphate nucleotidase CysQ [Bacteroidota bacterium]
MDNISLLKLAINASIIAGNEILKVYDTNFYVETKSDDTPVTLADKAASNSIIQNLASSNIPVLSEEDEQFHYSERKTWEHIWIVDPLDGTKEFVKRNGEFTVNIALIENQQPIIGVIFCPVFKDLYYACKDLGSFKVDKHDVLSILNSPHNHNIIEELITKAKKMPLQSLPKNYTIIASRSHLSKELYTHIEKHKLEGKIINTINVGSSVKMCWVAEGKAHEYPRFGTTMEWDTASGQCILEQAGGQLIDLETNLPMLYNREHLKNQNFIAIAKN